MLNPKVALGWCRFVMFEDGCGHLGGAVAQRIHHAQATVAMKFTVCLHCFRGDGLHHEDDIFMRRFDPCVACST